MSADRTSLDSKNYPHTRAILIQEAKFKYIPFGSAQWRSYGQQGQTQQQPGQQQQATPQQPAKQQQQATPQKPAEQQQQTAPQQPAQQQPAQKQPAAQEQPKAQAPAATGDASQFVQQVIDLTNAERSKNGLPALKADAQLNGVAQKKSVDMQQNNYFSHTSPTYGSPFDMMRDMGVSYKTAGENIAQGQRTPQEVVKAWMNSEGHKKNILSKNFTHIGVGYDKTGHHWTQMFIGK
ncbi:SCP-like extracellular protein [Bacillus sp. MRMR6]|nr:SCP-like extracellular protein [Bacillus sp. MRMR6]